jgi:hypothetical protein
MLEDIGADDDVEFAADGELGGKGSGDPAIVRCCGIGRRGARVRFDAGEMRNMCANRRAEVSRARTEVKNGDLLREREQPALQDLVRRTGNRLPGVS